MSEKTKIFIIQPLIAHYRIELYEKLNLDFDLIVVYGRTSSDFKQVKEASYLRKVSSINFLNMEFYFVMNLIREFRPNIVISYGESKQLVNLLLLFQKRFMDFKFLIWSHGIYTPLSLNDKLKILMMKLSDGVILYTEKCKIEMEKYGILQSTFLNNTLKIKNYSVISSQDLKNKYQINHKKLGIFVSRFSKEKSPELLFDLMKEINSKDSDIGFIVIGEGPFKPNFSNSNFIYDFGKTYDPQIKSNLFQLSDFAIMPRWVGLTLIEAFSYGVPMITLSERMTGIAHSVEINYLKHNENGYIAENKADLVEYVCRTNRDEYQRLGKNGKKLVSEVLTMENMYQNFSTFLKKMSLT